MGDASDMSKMLGSLCAAVTFEFRLSDASDVVCVN